MGSATYLLSSFVTILLWFGLSHYGDSKNPPFRNSPSVRAALAPTTTVVPHPPPKGDQPGGGVLCFVCCCSFNILSARPRIIFTVDSSIHASSDLQHKTDLF